MIGSIVLSAQLTLFIFGFGGHCRDLLIYLEL